MVAHGVGTEIALNAAGEAADWILLLPIGSGGVIRTIDGRGPYKVTDPAKLATASLQAAGGRLPIDENHATDLAAPRGEPAPARGWAHELEVRADGLYGRVQWSASGAALMSEKAYRFISPVITHDAGNNVLTMPRASLVNTPNLRGMPALNARDSADVSTAEQQLKAAISLHEKHMNGTAPTTGPAGEKSQQEMMDQMQAALAALSGKGNSNQETYQMDLLPQLRKILGLADDADEAAVMERIRALAGGSTAMQSIATAAGLAATADIAAILTAVTSLKAGTALQSIAKAAGLKDDADHAAIVAAVTTLAAGGADAQTIVDLQSELSSVTTKLNKLMATTATEKATAYVDGEIAKGRVGVKPVRDKYITMHAANPAQVEALIGAMPILGPSGALTTPPEIKDGKVSLNSEQLSVARLLGTKPEDYEKTLASERA